MAENTSNVSPGFIELAGEITLAWLQNPNVQPGAEDVPAFLKSMHAAITGLTIDGAAEAAPVVHQPAVSVRTSVKPDHIVSLIDGKKYKMLKRHLALNGLTPAQYRDRFGLKSDYPMVAPAYAERRRELAKKIGLGQKLAKPTAPKTKAASKSGATPEAKAPTTTAKRRRANKKAEAAETAVAVMPTLA
ncbi:MucR family transcriptional regulator [Novosphingobium rosa]|uniref:MucR family transcriptional regulator n=1 Tax=Novosphingobium rosa TaxID=76978 RepID=UPI00082B4971|nr:MucR family transcriptional regulator [Novosphingobium rosa]